VKGATSRRACWRDWTRRSREEQGFEKGNSTVICAGVRVPLWITSVNVRGHTNEARICRLRNGPGRGALSGPLGEEAPVRALSLSPSPLPVYLVVARYIVFIPLPDSVSSHSTPPRRLPSRHNTATALPLPVSYLRKVGCLSPLPTARPEPPSPRLPRSSSPLCRLLPVRLLILWYQRWVSGRP
jgi:hypothetical protein